jgi:hypothetical protein
MLCANDEMAIGILKAAKELNLNIPGDFAICGFDNTVNSCIVSPTLTTVRQPFEEIADCAFDILLKKIDNQETDDLKSFSGTLVKRESCGCQFDKNTLSSLSDANFRTIRGYKIHENIQTYYMDELFNQITGALVEFSIEAALLSNIPKVRCTLTILLYYPKNQNWFMHILTSSVLSLTTKTVFSTQKRFCPGTFSQQTGVSHIL